MIKNLKKKFYLRKIAEYKDIDGWLKEDEALILYKIARKMKKNSLVVEIGSWKGKSTFCIAKGLNKGSLLVIDPFNASGGQDIESEVEYKAKSGGVGLLEEFQRNMKKLKVLDKIIIKKGYSYEFDSEIDFIDFLFIDGDHSIEGCVRDYKLYSKKVKKGGYIAFHDYYENRNDLGPTFVVNNLILKSSEFKFYGQFDSIWVGKKI